MGRQLPILAASMPGIMSFDANYVSFFDLIILLFIATFKISENVDDPLNAHLGKHINKDESKL